MFVYLFISYFLIVFVIFNRLNSNCISIIFYSKLAILQIIFNISVSILFY